MTDEPTVLSDHDRALVELCRKEWLTERRDTSRTLRGVVLGVAAALLLSLAGTTLGWVLTSNEAAKRDRAINDSRRQVLTENCLETNMRNLGSLAKLDTLSPPHPTPRDTARLQATKLLISALVPFRDDCVAYAKGRVDTS